MPRTGLISICFMAALPLAGCTDAPQQPDKTVQQLMAQDIQPTADIYWKAVQFISDETGNHDIRPQTDAEWQRVEDAATKIVDYAELLKTPAYADGRGGDWVQFADSLAEVGKLAEQAAAEKDPDRVFEVGGTLYSVCSACHMIYPATTGPEAGQTPAD
jgi:hypothetical protein